jgi:hypothetical protein
MDNNPGFILLPAVGEIDMLILTPSAGAAVEVVPLLTAPTLSDVL